MHLCVFVLIHGMCAVCACPLIFLLNGPHQRVMTFHFEHVFSFCGFAYGTSDEFKRCRFQTRSCDCAAGRHGLRVFVCVLFLCLFDVIASIIAPDEHAQKLVVAASVLATFFEFLLRVALRSYVCVWV